MPTFNQLVKAGRKRPRYKTASPALQGCPQKRGVCLRSGGGKSVEDVDLPTFGRPTMPQLKPIFNNPHDRHEDAKTLRKTGFILCAFVP